MKRRIHILGASGSGTTSIAKAVCKQTSYTHFDTDDYLWMPTEVPFTHLRPVEERISLMEYDLGACEKWVNSGSLMSWGNTIIPLFDLVVFVYVPHDVRMERLQRREVERYGDTILPGGSRYESSQEFINWAATYDAGTSPTGRNLQKHRAWLKNITCDILEIVNHDFEESVRAVVNATTGCV